MALEELDQADLKNRRKLPDSIAKLMAPWRAGVGGMPPSYIAFHQAIAVDVLDALVQSYGIRVHSTELRDSGWFDGMKELHAIVEDPRGRVHHLVYNDSNQGFMLKLDVGGQARLRPHETFTR